MFWYDIPEKWVPRFGTSTNETLGPQTQAPKMFRWDAGPGTLDPKILKWDLRP